jgi:E3 ubiquitin-protein ligase BOI-like protein
MKPPQRLLDSIHHPCVVFHNPYSPALDNATSASPSSLGHPGGGHPLPAAVGGNTVLSDLTSSNNNGCFLPRKRARVGDVSGAGAGLIMDLQGQRALLPPVPVPVPVLAGDVQRRLLCSAAASTTTSGRPTASVAPVSQSQGLLSHLYHHGVEIDALVRIEVS